MSRKSGFSITGALKSPRIECKLPHHPEALGGGHSFEIVVFGALMKAANADRRWIGHTEIYCTNVAIFRSGLTSGNMRGVKFLVDRTDRKTAVVLDLRRNAALWEDVYDSALARSRAREPRESLVSVRRRLQKSGKLFVFPT
jgi:hypothetical protein